MRSMDVKDIGTQVEKSGKSGNGDGYGMGMMYAWKS